MPMKEYDFLFIESYILANLWNGVKAIRIKSPYLSHNNNLITYFVIYIYIFKSIKIIWIP